MIQIAKLETERLILRQWTESDRVAFALLNADDRVMASLPAVLNKSESDALADRIEALIARRGWGLWALELKQNPQFIGFVGLHEPTYDLPFTPCVEIGWRLAREHWGKGYATEAANAALDYAFKVLALNEVYSFTSVINKKSRAVMQRLNMLDTQQNFVNPMLADNDSLREHVLYKIDRHSYLIP